MANSAPMCQALYNNSYDNRRLLKYLSVKEAYIKILYKIRFNSCSAQKILFCLDYTASYQFHLDRCHRLDYTNWRMSPDREYWRSVIDYGMSIRHFRFYS